MASRTSQTTLTQRSNTRARPRAQPTSPSTISKSSTDQVKTIRRALKGSAYSMESTPSKEHLLCSPILAPSTGKRTNLYSSNSFRNSNQGSSHHPIRCLTHISRDLDMARTDIICLQARDSPSREGYQHSRRTLEMLDHPSSKTEGSSLPCQLTQT